jgi:hypothetical protein
VKSTLALFLLSALCVTPAFQPSEPRVIRGMVAGTSGERLSDVQVDLWSDAGHIASVRTTSTGAFAFKVARTPEPVRVQARRVGYRSLTMPLYARDSVVRLEMEPIDAPLPTVIVEAARRVCPNKDDPQAIRVWSVARQRYRPGVAGKGTAREARSRSESIAADLVGTIDESRLRALWSARLGVPQRALSHRLATEGYATPLNYRRAGYQSLDADFVAWRYAELHGQEAYHFAEPTFGEMNTLSLINSGSGGFSLGFCPRRKTGTRIEGILELSPDTALVSAAWHFRTPKPDEKAGGEVAFLPPNRMTPAYLLPSSGIFWRRMNRGERYWQTSTTYLRWAISADSTMPVFGPGSR